MSVIASGLSAEVWMAKWERPQPKEKPLKRRFYSGSGSPAVNTLTTRLHACVVLLGDGYPPLWTVLSTSSGAQCEVDTGEQQEEGGLPLPVPRGCRGAWRTEVHEETLEKHEPLPLTGVHFSVC